MLSLAVLSFLFLGESYSLLTRAGIFAAMTGAFQISLEDPVNSLKHVESWKSLSAALTAAALYAMREVFFKLFSSSKSIWMILAYLGLFSAFLSVLMLVGESRTTPIDDFTGTGLLDTAGLLSGTGLILFFLAVSLGPVSLVTTITKTRFLIIFIGATAISRLHPEIIHEPFDRATLIQRLFATILSLVGVSIIMI